MDALKFCRALLNPALHRFAQFYALLLLLNNSQLDKGLHKQKLLDKATYPRLTPPFTIVVVCGFLTESMQIKMDAGLAIDRHLMQCTHHLNSPPYLTA